MCRLILKQNFIISSGEQLSKEKAAEEIAIVEGGKFLVLG